MNAPKGDVDLDDNDDDDDDDDDDAIERPSAILPLQTNRLVVIYTRKVCV